MRLWSRYDSEMSCRSLASVLDQDVVGTIVKALLTMHLPVRKPDDLTAWTPAAGSSNASPTYRFPSRNPVSPSTFSMDDWIDYYDSTHTIYASKLHRDLHFQLIARDIIGYIASPDAVVLDLSLIHISEPT